MQSRRLDTSSNDTANTVKKPTNLITDEMAYDYAMFLLHLWKSKQKANKINEKGEVSMDEE